MSDFKDFGGNFSKYLAETEILDFSSASIVRLVEARGWTNLPETEKIKSIYNFVKDEIAFGYNVSDDIKASLVLADGYGQCNTKGVLFMALLRACGVPCRIHGVNIDKKLQKGAMSGLVYKAAPVEIFHSYVEVFSGGTVYSLEGFILDEKYLSALQKRFKPDADGSFMGYGVAVKNFSNPPVNFNCCNTFIQSEGIVRDFGVFDSPDELFKAHGQQMNCFKALVYRLLGRRLMNRNVKKIRNGESKK